MHEIKRDIYYENSFPGVTLGAIICPQGTVLIDAPLRADDARTWLAMVFNWGESSNRILVNLDAHPDRTLGARSMDCTIIAHQRAAQIFRGRPSIFKGQNTESGSEWETFDDVVGTRWAVPDITFSSRISLYWGAFEIIMEHHPGPSLGAIWVDIPAAGVVFIGDAVLDNQPPFLTNADLPAWIESLDTLLSSYREYTIIGGRGGPVPFNTVRAQQEHLKKIMKGLDRLAKRNAPPEATESLIPKLLADLEFPLDMKEQYTHRYRHGLLQCYAHQYRQSNSIIEA